MRKLEGGPDKLKQVLERSLLLAMPKNLLGEFADVLRGGASDTIPSSSLLRRYELAFDLAMIACEHDRSAQVGARRVIFAMSDASPVASHDWLWSSQTEVLVDKLVLVFVTFLRVSASIESYCIECENNGETVELAPLPEWLQDLGILAENIREYIHPPGAIAGGHRGLAHKCGVEVFKWHLSVDPSIPLREHAKRFASHTADLGVEFGIPKFTTSDPERLLPEWVNRTPLELDIASEPDTDTGDDDDKVNSDVAWADLDDAKDDPSAAEDDDEHIMMPHCLPIAGLQHIVDNLLKDVHLHMQYWETFSNILKHYEALLRSDENRMRLRWTLLRGTRYEHFEKRLLSWSASLYEARWHEVVKFLKKLIPVIEVLAIVWDEQKYRSNLNARGEELEEEPVVAPAANEEAGDGDGSKRGGPMKLDPKVIADSAQSTFFNYFVHLAFHVEEIPEKLIEWATACECHWPLREAGDFSAYQLQQMCDLHFGGRGLGFCIMCGRRAPELVAGKLVEILKLLWQVLEVAMQLLPPVHSAAPLSEEEWDLLITNSQSALANAIAVLRA